MDNFKTIELRWFYPGVLPHELLVWFDTLGEPLAKPDRRTDVYLQSNSPDMGIKLRQGNLEVKYRQAQLGAISIDGFNPSQVEKWSKWICVDDLSGLTSENIANKPGWSEVDKIRYQRLYQVQFSGYPDIIGSQAMLQEQPRQHLQLRPITQPQDGAAAIEITQLWINKQPWWTIACEYLGDNIDLDLQFSPLVNLLLSIYPCPASGQSISCGYPQWLLNNKLDTRILTD
jgi:hypothetical protein